MADLDTQLEQFQNVSYRMRAEGMHYCFEHYSSFEEIVDPKFHEIREAYLKAASELTSYVDTRIQELNDVINEF
jgi:hypothetical protein